MALQTVWLNDGKADDKGIIRVQIRDGERIVSSFKGRNLRTLTQRVLDSSVASAAEIDRLKAGRVPDRAAVGQPLKPRELTPDERFTLSTRSMDPNNLPDVIQEVVETTMGAPLNVVADQLKAQRDEEIARYYAGEAQAFADNTPSFYPDEAGANKDRLLSELARKGWDLTRNNLTLVYDELESQNLMIRRPSTPGQRQEPKPSAEPNLPSPTRHSGTVSTGIRQSSAPPARTPSRSVTQADVDKMDRHELRRRIESDPVFRAQVDALPPRQ